MREIRTEEKLLGLVPGYDAAALKAAYRRALSRWHPDRFASSSQARRDAVTERTRRIIEAHATLAARLTDPDVFTRHPTVA